MVEDTEKEDQGESWELYAKALGTDKPSPEQPDQPAGISVPSEGEEETPSTVDNPVSAVRREGKPLPSKRRRKSVSRKVAADLGKPGSKSVNIYFPFELFQQLKIVSMAENRSVSEIVREAVSGYVESVFADCVKSLPVSK